MFSKHQNKAILVIKFKILREFDNLNGLIGSINHDDLHSLDDLNSLFELVEKIRLLLTKSWVQIILCDLRKPYTLFSSNSSDSVHEFCNYIRLDEFFSHENEQYIRITKQAQFLEKILDS